MRASLARETLLRVYARVASRYDAQHGLLTGWSDQRGRVLLVDHAVKAGDKVLDCGAGTGSTALLAAHKVGRSGQVALFDLSEEMLGVAREKAVAAGQEERVTFHVGDLLALPFADGAFDVVLSTYSLCPLYDPAEGARELYRVTRPGGRLGIAHSAEPDSRFVKAIAAQVERLIWLVPSISLGCRPVSVLPALMQLGARILFQRKIGVPLWPFQVFVVEKPARAK